MKYPDWAPKTLVDLHERRIEEMDERRGLEEIGAHRISFSEKEETTILKKLITHVDMKGAWITLTKRAASEEDAHWFLMVCGAGIQEWRNSKKLVKSQRKMHFQKIHEHAKELSKLMSEAGEFRFFQINRLMNADSIVFLFNVLNASLPPEGEDEGPSEDKDKIVLHMRELLSGVSPSIHMVLNDIADMAIKFSEEKPVVLKPGSVNADIHYFIRALSARLNERYEQPLHAVVATTTKVLFDPEGVDVTEGYVRKLVELA